MPGRVLCLLALALAACTDEGMLVTSTTCKSGLTWAGGDQESPLMHPGGDCVGCHASRQEGPTFAIAGTVFSASGAHETNDCAGLAGVTVTITDKNAKVFTLTSNAAGNFFLKKQDGSPAAPYTAAITYKGVTRKMIAEQVSGACNTCHTPARDNDAPGRIALLP